MIRKFLSYYKPHLKLFTIDMICALIVAACNLSYPIIVDEITKTYVADKNVEMILILGGLLLIIYIVKAFLNFVIQYWGHILGVRIQGDMRKDIFIQLQSLPFSYLDENKTGTIMSRIINDLMDISELAHHGPEDLFISAVSLIGAFIVMLTRVDYRLSIIVFAFIPIIVWFAVIRRKKMQHAFKSMREKVGEINASVESSISGIRVSRAYSAKDYEIEKFEHANEAFKHARADAYKQMGIFGSGMGFFTDFLYLAIIIVGGLLIATRTADFEIATAIVCITTVISPIRTLIAIFEQIQSGMTGFTRFQEIMNEEKEKEHPNPITLKGIEKNITFEKFHSNTKNAIKIVKM